MYLYILVFSPCPLPFYPLLQAVLRPVRCCCHVVGQVLSERSKYEDQNCPKHTDNTLVKLELNKDQKFKIMK